MADHPDLERLIAFAFGEQQGGETEALRSHVATCVECGATVAQARLAAETVRLDETMAPPVETVARAKALFATAPHPAEAGSSDFVAPLRRIVAELVFDSAGGLTPGLAGFRGTGDRHLTYVAEAIQVDLRLQPPGEPGAPWHVQGQLDTDEVLPLATVDVVPAGDGHAMAHVKTDERGMFALTLPAGRYDILVRLRDAVRVLPGLVLG